MTTTMAGCERATDGCVDAVDRDQPVTTRCYACGLTVCEGCSVNTPYFPERGTQRVCYGCLVDHDLWTEAQVAEFIATRTRGQDAADGPPGGFRCNRPLRDRNNNCNRTVHTPGIPCTDHGFSR